MYRYHVVCCYRSGFYAAADVEAAAETAEKLSKALVAWTQGSTSSASATQALYDLVIAARELIVQCDAVPSLQPSLLAVLETVLAVYDSSRPAPEAGGQPLRFALAQASDNHD